MCWEVVQVHVTGVWITVKQILVEFDNFLELSDVSFQIDVVFIHYVTPHFHLLHISGRSFHKDGRSLNDEADIYSHHIAREDLELSGVDVELQLESVHNRCLLDNFIGFAQVLFVIDLLH